MPRARSVARWLLPLLVLLVWLGSAGPLSLLGAKLTGLQENDVTAFLPDSAESTRVQNLQARFQPVQPIPAALRWGSGPRIGGRTVGAVTERVRARTRTAGDADRLPGQVSPPIPSADGE